MLPYLNWELGERLEARRTHLLSDEPASKDEFGPHRRIAELICHEIRGSASGRTIAVVGDWGSGKSTVVKLLEAALGASNESDTHLFVYDAWSHQGDSLRRAFLDDLIGSLKSSNLLKKEESDKAIEKVWNRVETTETTTEPVLRTHAKWLLVALVVAALGFELFELPADPAICLWDGLLLARNIAAYFLLLSPALLVVAFAIVNRCGPSRARKYLFGETTDRFSVLSFFFERVQGQVERRNVKSPIDSITEFRDVFDSLIEFVRGNEPRRKVVIIVDNIDRIPPDRAREFWSTMQTFFDERRNSSSYRAMNYWLIAPFSIEALAFIFRGTAPGGPEPFSEQDVSHAKAYIDKTFGVVFHVPPPILANWRRYLFSNLREAFPEHDEADLTAVRDIFDSVRSADQSRITPREMKLFVNGLVLLYRQRGEEISLPLMAAYVLRRDGIKNAEIVSDLLSAREKRIIDEADWRARIAALHFGVGLTEATQILLQEPIRGALIEGSGERLKRQENQHGFFDVLPRVVSQELEKPENSEGVAVTLIARTISNLENPDDSRLQGVWRTLANHLKSISKWDRFSDSPGEGIKAILQHSRESQRIVICEAISQSLSKAAIPDPDDGLPIPNVAVRNWLRAAIAVLSEWKGPYDLDLSAPGSAKVQLEMLEQLSNAKLDEKIKLAIKFAVTGQQLASALTDHITAGRHVRSPAAFVPFALRSIQEIDWGGVTQACENRLRIPSLTSDECVSSIELLLAIAHRASYAPATTALKTLSTQGHLPHQLVAHQKVLSARAAIVLATILSNPNYERPAHFERSAKGDGHYNSLVASSIDSDLASAIADIMLSVGAPSRVFEAGATHTSIASLVASIIGSVSTSDRRLDIEPATIVEQQAFIEAYAAILVPSSLVRNLEKARDLVDLLLERPFDIDMCHIYLATLDVAREQKSADYLDFLQRGVLSLEQASWERAIGAATGSYHHLIALCSGLKKANPAFQLSTNVRDGVLVVVRKVGRGEIETSTVHQEHAIALIDLIQPGLQASLQGDILEDMIAVSDVFVARVVEFVGARIRLSGVFAPDRIVQRIFTPILVSPSEVTINWVIDAIDSRRDFFDGLSRELKEELASRLHSALRSAESYSPDIVAGLTKVADLFRVNPLAEGSEG